MTTKQVEAKDGVVVTLNNSNNQLDEVVVTAMGVKRDRKALGYAAQDLKAEELNTEGTTSLASAIQGKLTGVSVRQSSGAPGASAQIVIRGARSFDGNNAPLYVIDGYCSAENFGSDDEPDWQYVLCEPGDEAYAKESAWYYYPVWIDYSPSIQVMSEAELYFILAEAYARTNHPADASIYFNMAVLANFDDYANIYGADFGGDDFITQWAGGVTLKDIMVQKYISQIRDEQIEAYNDIRRCKALGEEFITLTNPWNNQNGINRWPERLPYGNSSVISNSKIKEAYGDGSYIFTEKTWLYGGTR